MLKGFRTISLTCLLMSAVFGLGAEGISANTLSGTGDMTINVSAPSQNALYFEQVPNLTFGVAKNTEHQLKGTGDSVYKVADLRGGSDGYTIQVNVGSFKIKGTTRELPVDSLQMTVLAGDDSLITGGNNVDVYQQQGVVAKGTGDANGLRTSGAISAMLTLDSKTAAVPSGSYSATVVHSLVSGI